MAQAPTARSDSEIQKLLEGPHNPAAKFLRELNLSIEDARRLDILALLTNLPRKERTKYGKRKALTPEERNELTKQRNREHARSTRKRKKIIMEALQSQVNELQRKLEPMLECKVLETNTEHVQSVRIANLKKFFSYRNTNLSHTYDDWVEVVCENIRFTSPVLPFGHKEARGPSAVRLNTHTYIGIDALIRDIVRFPSSMADYLDAAVGSSSFSIEACFSVNNDEIVAVADTIMCHWVSQIVLNQGQSKTKTIVNSGMAKCRYGFCDVKLVSVDLRYDVLGFLRQLEAATGAQLVTKVLDSAKSGQSDGASSKVDSIPAPISNIPQILRESQAESEINHPVVSISANIQSPGLKKEA
uniref:BZIP domain-containing protein n=1 Tax=Fibrocapsa japonica TaxID=94617 RepID=A0A7S2XWF6_9STRA|mmetsp:Transcript_15912/g.23399  ORF Transcript_15912/g.23399 Transcript_15912/m.23399 type:complete len:358 (+) Transcript_15912:83-1156(+)|eukprot:CAMPEP_0113937746 /NCGR_PEP_ID=MMETSP1339-20121228/4298_1 /TAXON_ID=94617 /ORGANISM="Fibrocapsa japonica" /LENGTH=357 /DNA_ID=CAMNT_0000940629 /DNA_START=51 /DNA_END=1124 /DNA_ORIENTATION=+ /assembly_acc=CAM_ASM_000762